MSPWWLCEHTCVAAEPTPRNEQQQGRNAITSWKELQAYRPIRFPSYSCSFMDDWQIQYDLKEGLPFSKEKLCARFLLTFGRMITGFRPNIFFSVHFLKGWPWHIPLPSSSFQALQDRGVTRLSCFQEAK